MLENEKTFLAQRYAELFEIAKAAIETFELLNSRKDIDREIIKFRTRHCTIITIMFSISSIEAFINHLGYIFDDDWESKYERKNFWVQYTQLRKILKKIGVNDIPDSPFDIFKAYREMVRNPAHHVRASKHDVSYKKSTTINHEIESQEIKEMFNSWIPHMSYEEVYRFYRKTEVFILSFQEKFRTKQLHGLELFRILEPLRKNKFDDDQLRQKALRRYIDFPFTGPSITNITRVKKG